MASIVDIIVIFVMSIILLAYIRNQYGEVEYVSSKVDGRRYLVRKLPDDQRAADRLAQLNESLIRLVQHTVAKYGRDNADVRRLYANFDPDNMSEGGMEHGYTSYSVNKGEKIVMCIRQKDRSFVDMNVLVYVAIHELAHLMTADVGHTKKFWANFRFLLEEAVSLDMYRRDDYADKPADYCGIRITSSVIVDPSQG